VAASKACWKTPHLQWRARSGLTPDSLFSPGGTARYSVSAARLTLASPEVKVGWPQGKVFCKAAVSKAVVLSEAQNKFAEVATARTIVDEGIGELNFPEPH
jgi:hypothetical protein